MKITVQVTANHIKGAHRENPARCPIARAIKGLVNPKVKVRVEIEDVYFDGLGVYTTTRLPRAASKFIEQFDSSNKLDKAQFAPFSFTLNLRKELLVG